MSKVINIRDFQEKRNQVYFSQPEMTQLLCLYGTKARKGEWKDYAVEQRNGIVAFSVFKGMYDAPAFTVAKCLKAPRSGLGRFLLLSGPQKLAQSDDLAEVLSYFAREDMAEDTTRVQLSIVK